MNTVAKLLLLGMAVAMLYAYQYPSMQLWRANEAARNAAHEAEQTRIRQEGIQAFQQAIANSRRNEQFGFRYTPQR